MWVSHLLALVLYTTAGVFIKLLFTFNLQNNVRYTFISPDKSVLERSFCYVSQGRWMQDSDWLIAWVAPYIVFDISVKLYRTGGALVCCLCIPSCRLHPWKILSTVKHAHIICYPELARSLETVHIAVAGDVEQSKTEVISLFSYLK